MKQEQCSHEWVEYKQCCYCGAFDNGRNIIEERTQANMETLRKKFIDWYLGVKGTNGNYPPLAMQIFHWFDENVGLFDSLYIERHFELSEKDEDLSEAEIQN